MAFFLSVKLLWKQDLDFLTSLERNRSAFNPRVQCTNDEISNLETFNGARRLQESSQEMGSDIDIMTVRKSDKLTLVFWSYSV